MFASKDVFAHQIVAQAGAELRMPPSLLPDCCAKRILLGAVDNMGCVPGAFERYEQYPRWNHDGSQPWRTASSHRSRRQAPR